MIYVTLLLEPSAAQKASLTQLLAGQRDHSSAEYHRWLTPEQYADKFGLNPADMQAILSWLGAQGLTVNYQARGRNWIAFSGDAAHIERTFRTEIHQYTIEGVTHFSNTTDPSIPAGLAGIVSAIRGLNDFRLQSALARKDPVPRSGTRPAYDNPGGGYNLAPGDLATIYNFGSLTSYSSGQTMVVGGRREFTTPTSPRSDRRST